MLPLLSKKLMVPCLVTFNPSDKYLLKEKDYSSRNEVFLLCEFDCYVKVNHVAKEFGEWDMT